jgi:hypothetical protein
MNGMQMLLQAIGVDPVEIQATIEKAKKDIPEFASKIDARVKAIEEKIDSLLEVTKQILENQAMIDKGLILEPPKIDAEVIAFKIRPLPESLERYLDETG